MKIPSQLTKTGPMPGEVILIAEDDRAMRQVLTRALEREGYAVKATSTGATLWEWIAAGEGRLVITDVVLPDGNGLDLASKIGKRRRDLRVIVMSAQNTLLTAVKAAQRGAFEYLPKPFDIEVFLDAVARALSQPPANGVEPAIGLEEEGTPLIGRSPAMQEIYRVMARLMVTDLTVLLCGESGTGKELVARALHDYGSRREEPFVALNMAAIPRELIESELFGHAKGAFTGAVASHPGRFAQAAGGTLFLDEIGDMPAEAQTRLLRVLQDGEYTAVGGRTVQRAQARIIAATHRDLRQLVAQGVFREDLYYRLSVVPMQIPPLRERISDIPDLVSHFLREAAGEGAGEKILARDAVRHLQQYDWPGNVRELENLIRRLVVLYGEDLIGTDIVARELAQNAREGQNHADETAGKDNAGQEKEGELAAAFRHHLARYFSNGEGILPATNLHRTIVAEVERPLIAMTLDATGGNQLKSAQILGLNRNTLRKKIRSHDIRILKRYRKTDASEKAGESGNRPTR